MKCALDLVEGCDGDRVCDKCGGCERHCTCKTEAEQACEKNDERYLGYNKSERLLLKEGFLDGFEAGQKAERERILKIIKNYIAGLDDILRKEKIEHLDHFETAQHTAEWLKKVIEGDKEPAEKGDGEKVFCRE